MKESSVKGSMMQLSELERLSEEMDLNDYLVTVSFILLLIFICVGLSVWMSKPRLIDNDANKGALTHLMDGNTRGPSPKLRRKVKKRKLAYLGANGTANSLGTGTATETNCTTDHNFITSSMEVVIQREDDNGDERAHNNTSSYVNADVPVETTSIEGTNFIRTSTNYNRNDLSGDGVSTCASASTSASGSGSHSLGAKSSKSTGVYEENLKKSLYSLLQNGMNITWHRGGGKTAKSVRLSLSDPHGDILCWRGTRMLARNNYETSLVKVTSIEWGKNTDAFHSSVEAKSLSNDICFSFVLDPFGSFKTLDLQTSSKMERDLLVQGFTLIIGDLKRDQAFEQL